MDLIKFETINGNNEEINKCLEYIKGLFADEKCFIKEYEFNKTKSLIIKNFDGKEADIILNGHIDVVGAQEKKQFEPILSEGKLYGRGALDMKSGVSIMIHVMKALLQQGFKDKKIMLIINSDEEIGGFNGVNLLINKEGYRGKFVIIPDGGNLQEIIYAEKGIIQLKIKANGKACHASKRRLGQNAIEKAYDFYLELKNKLENKENLNEKKQRWSTTVNITNIHGGIGNINVIPDEADMTIDIRFTQEWNESTLSEFIQNLAKDRGVEIEKPISGEILYSDPDNEYITQYIEFARQYINNKVKLSKDHCACDGRFFKGSVVILHQANGGNIHGKDEYSETQDYQKLYNLYISFIQNSNF